MLCSCEPAQMGFKLNTFDQVFIENFKLLSNNNGIFGHSNGAWPCEPLPLSLCARTAHVLRLRHLFSACFPIGDSLMAYSQGNQHFSLLVALLALLAQGKALRMALLPLFTGLYLI